MLIRQLISLVIATLLVSGAVVEGSNSTSIDATKSASTNSSTVASTEQTTPAPTTPAPAPAPVTCDETFDGDGLTSSNIIKLSIKYDDTPHENSWHVFRGFGDSKEELFWSDFFAIQQSGMRTTCFKDMQPGIYTFAIADFMANGIQDGEIVIREEVSGVEKKLWQTRNTNFGTILVQTITILP